MSHRDLILGRLRDARGRLVLPASPPPAPFEPGPSRSVGEAVERFVSETAALGVVCHVESSAGAVRERLRPLVEGETVLSWDPDQLPFDAAQVIAAPVTAADSRARQAGATVGVTGCDAAIADTGSVVMFAARGRSRAVSLLPPTHVVLIRREQLCFTMGEMFTRFGTSLVATAGCVVITGPSRTADIELTLTLGIHGPGQVVAIVGP